MVKIQMNKKMSNSLYDDVEISNAVERSVLLKLENNIYLMLYIILHGELKLGCRVGDINVGFM